MSTIEKAIEIAARAHAGQVDKAGAPYVLHPLRLMLSVKTLHQQMAAVLHDVIEDTQVTLEDLRAEGFPQEVLYAQVKELLEQATATEQSVSAAADDGH